jgi:transposase-like protein
MAGDQDAAQAVFECARWPQGFVCPHCGSSRPPYSLQSGRGVAHPVGPGVRKCADCRRKFTVITETVFAGSHISLRSWLIAIDALRKEPSVSALEIQRRLDLKSYRSALFLCRRIRWAMGQPPLKGRIVASIEEVMRLLLEVKPIADMPRPGAHRQKSVWAEVEAEYED